MCSLDQGSPCGSLLNPYQRSERGCGPSDYGQHQTHLPIWQSRLEIRSPSRFRHSPPKALQLEPKRGCILVSHFSSGLEQRVAIRHWSAVIDKHSLIFDPGASGVPMKTSKPIPLRVRKPSIHVTLVIGTPVLASVRRCGQLSPTLSPKRQNREGGKMLAVTGVLAMLTVYYVIHSELRLPVTSNPKR